MVNEAIKEADDRTTKKITHKGFAKDSIVQQYVQYAYQIWGMDLVTLIDCENGTWNMYRQSEVVGRQRIIKWQRCSDYVKNRFILE